MNEPSFAELRDSVRELRDSVAFAAGVGFERRRCAEVLRMRAQNLQLLPGPCPRTLIAELRRLADLFDATPC